MRRVRAVLFDLDDTLFDSTGLSDLARRSAIQAMIEAGLDIDPNLAYGKLMEVVREFGSNYGKHFDRFLERIGVGWDPRLIAIAVYTYHKIKFAHLRPYPETIPVLLELKKRGLKLGVVTDGNPVKQWDKIIRLGIDSLLDVVVTSEEVGYEKPHPAIYLEATSRLGVDPRETIMVGDRLKDVVGAKRIGMISVRIRRGKYSSEEPRSEEEKPDFEIRNLYELLDILEDL